MCSSAVDIEKQENFISPWEINGGNAAFSIWARVGTFDTLLGSL